MKELKENRNMMVNKGLLAGGTKKSNRYFCNSLFSEGLQTVYRLDCMKF